jgi:ABC-type lipoprotein release transport system permease subunit
MEKISALSKLGIKYLYRYRKRYGFLFAALVFCFAVVTFITSSKDGMYDNVYYAAQSHYAGDIIAVGYNPSIPVDHMGKNEISAVLDAVHESGISPRHIVRRTLFGERGVVFFNGNAILQKYVIGCDWEAEAHLFNRKEFSYPIDPNIGDDGIILSEPVARQLGAVMGDSIVLEVDTIWGQKNTGVFIVSGIVRDFSLFGYYKIYISRLSLNRLLLLNDEDCSVIGFFLDNPAAAEKKRLCLQNVLAQKMHVGPLVHNRDDMILETNQRWGWGEHKVFLYTMPVFLSEISDLLDAMNILTYFLYGMMLIIIIVSAAVTYRLILHERAREMGIMRVIGFYGGDLRHVLWIEILALGVISTAAGFLLAWVFSLAASFASFSWFPSFEIFLKNGRLSVLYLPGTVLFNTALTFFVLAAAVFIPSLRASRKHLPSLIAGEPL